MKGTVFLAENFCPDNAAKLLWKAIDGLGTDENSIIKIVSSCNNYQRQLIKLSFFNLFHKELLKELNSEIRIRLSLDFRQLLRALFMSPLDFDTHCLKMCVKGLGTNEKGLVEILLTKTSNQLEKIRVEYNKKFGVSLEEDVAQDTSGDFRKIVVPLCRVKRKSSVNVLEANRVACEIDKSFTQFKGSDTPRFDLIGFCCRESYPQILFTFQEYKKVKRTKFHSTVI